MAGADWKSFADQITILKGRSMTVADDAQAVADLERIGYYCLSGYWYPFRQLKAAPVGLSFREDNFVPNSRFEDAVALYLFDKELRLLAMDALERIERAVRVDIAHLLGERECFAQHDPAQFHGNFSKQVLTYGPNRGSTEYQVWFQHYSNLVRRNRKQPFVAHNLGKHGRLPIWVAIEILDFGSMSRLFEGLKFADRDTIAAKYGTTGLELQKWLRSLNFVRNVAAHHSRMWNMNVLELSPVPQYDANWRSLSNARPFMYFCIMQKLLQCISPASNWGGRFKGLMAGFPHPANGAVSPSDFGAKQGWEGWPLWA